MSGELEISDDRLNQSLQTGEDSGNAVDRVDKRFQFSVKHLIILTTIIAVPFAFDIGTLVDGSYYFVFEFAWCILIAKAVGMTDRKKIVITGLVGAVCIGFVFDRRIMRELTNYMSYWLVPAAITVVLLVLGQSKRPDSDLRLTKRFSREQVNAAVSLACFFIGAWLMKYSLKLVVSAASIDNGNRNILFAAGMIWAPLIIVPVWLASLAIIAPLGFGSNFKSHNRNDVGQKTGSVFGWIALVALGMEFCTLVLIAGFVIFGPNSIGKALMILMIAGIAYLLSWTGWIAGLSMVTVRLIGLQFPRYPDMIVYGLAIGEIIAVIAIMATT